MLPSNSSSCSSATVVSVTLIGAGHTLNGWIGCAVMPLMFVWRACM